MSRMRGLAWIITMSLFRVFTALMTLYCFSTNIESARKCDAIERHPANYIMRRFITSLCLVAFVNECSIKVLIDLSEYLQEMQDLKCRGGFYLIVGLCSMGMTECKDAKTQTFSRVGTCGLPECLQYGDIANVMLMICGFAYIIAALFRFVASPRNVEIPSALHHDLKMISATVPMHRVQRLVHP